MGNCSESAREHGGFSSSLTDEGGMKGEAVAKNKICLWYDKDAEAAARFYAETFPASRRRAAWLASAEVHRTKAFPT